MSSRTRRPGAVQATLIIAMAIWGMNVTAVKVSTESFSPIALAALRMIVACAALTGVVLWNRCGVPKPNWREGVPLVACAFLMVYANQILFVEGLLRSTATNGALINALSPLVSALLAAVAFGERITLIRIVGVMLGFAGVSAVVLSHPGASVSSKGVGDLLLVGGVICFATGGAIVQRLAYRLHPLSISWAIYLLGTMFLVAHDMLGEVTLSAVMLVPGWAPWGLVLFSGVISTAIGNLIWNSAIATIGVARTAVYFYWVPVFGIAFAVFVLGETFTAWHVFGFFTVMLGTYMGTRPTRVVKSGLD